MAAFPEPRVQESLLKMQLFRRDFDTLEGPTTLRRREAQKCLGTLFEMGNVDRVRAFPRGYSGDLALLKVEKGKKNVGTDPFLLQSLVTVKGRNDVVANATDLISTTAAVRVGASVSGTAFAATKSATPRGHSESTISWSSVARLELLSAPSAPSGSGSDTELSAPPASGIASSMALDIEHYFGSDMRTHFRALIDRDYRKAQDMRALDLAGDTR